MKVHLYDQRTPDWYAAHVGKLTGSSAKHVLKERQRGNGELEGRITLRHRLVAERLSGQFSDDIGPFLPAAMQRGVDLEPMAFAAYEAATGQLVDRVGFVEHDELKAGCSPDGVVNDFEGIIELKCPSIVTHTEYWRCGGVPEEYWPQVVHNLWITGAQWCDFVSFDDRYPTDFQLFRVRVERAAVNLDDYEAKVRAFLASVDDAWLSLLTCANPGQVLAAAVEGRA